MTGLALVLCALCAPAAEEPIPLFNGTNLDGWYTFLKERGRDNDPEKVFTVADGMIHISGKEWGCITTKEEYADYHLVIEFKWGENAHPPREDRARDSGLLVHSTGEDGAYGGIWMHSIECQMIEGGTGDFIVVGDGSEKYSLTCPVAPETQADCHVFDPNGEPVTIHSGRINWYGRDPEWQDVKGFRGKQDVEKPVGEWNTYECIADGPELTVILNGTVVNRATNAVPSKGRIQIQSEAAELFVRRIELTPLDTSRAAETEAGDDPVITSGAIGEKEHPLLLVANKHDNTLSFVNAETLAIIQTIPTGPNPHEMVITPDQRVMYLSNYAPPGNTISVIDLVTRAHVKQIATGNFARIHGAAMAPDGRNAYFTAGQTGYVVEVDTQTHEVTRGIPTQGAISHMVLVSNDGERLYTANIESKNVSVLDRRTGELLTQVPCGEGVEGMAFTPDTKHLWAANQTGGSITIIDVATHTAVATFPCPGMPVRIRFTKDGAMALVPSWTEKGELIIIDVASRTEIKRVPAGGYAIGVEITPDGRRAFVGCEHEDGVHVIDMATLTVEAVIKTGNGPDPMAIWLPAA